MLVPPGILSCTMTTFWLVATCFCRVSTACNIDRLSSISMGEFQKHYWRAKPVIVMVGAENLSISNPKQLKKHFGSWQVYVGKSFEFAVRGTHRMKLGPFLSKSKKHGWKDGLDYVFDMEKCNELRPFFQTPKFVRKVSRPDWIQYFVVGHSGAGVSTHDHAEGWNFLVYGRKTWSILPPGAEEAWSSLLWGPETTVCEQYAGEVLYLPAQWGHSTRGVDETFAVATQGHVRDTGGPDADDGPRDLIIMGVVTFICLAVSMLVVVRCRARGAAGRPEDSGSVNSSPTSELPAKLKE